MKRSVKLDKNGDPVTITLPRASQFTSGSFCSIHTSCGCLLGHAYYAWGVEFYQETARGRTHRPITFSREILKELGAGYAANVWLTFDQFYKDAAQAGQLAQFLEIVAHKWRVVADRWGWDVRASEPEWNP